MQNPIAAIGRDCDARAGWRVFGRFALKGALSVAALAASGCAYLTTFKSEADLSRDHAVAIDVKQRVVFSRSLPMPPELSASTVLVTKTTTSGPPNAKGESSVVETTKTTMIPGPGADAHFVATCAEPSPDALTVISANAGFSLSELQKGANASAALSEQGASIGLRTQSIQLLRDAMYRLCEGYASGAVGTAQFTAMQRRFQSTMMGLLAIEQLTRPVVAAQAMLNSSGTSSTGASPDSIADAQKKYDDQASVQLEATNKYNSDKATLANQQAKAAKSKAAAEALTKGADGYDQAQADAENDAATVNTSTATVANDKASLDAANTVLDARRQALLALKASTSSSTGGGGNFNSGAFADASQKTSEHLVKGIVKIVREINQSYARDHCLALMEALAETNPKSTQLAMAQSIAGKAPAPDDVPDFSDASKANIYACTRIILSEVTRATLDNEHDAALELAKQENANLKVQLEIAKAKAVDPAVHADPAKPADPAAAPARAVAPAAAKRAVKRLAHPAASPAAPVAAPSAPVT